MGYLIQRLSFGGILDQSFRLLRDHFLALSTPMLAVYVPFNVIMDAMGMSDPATMASPENLAAFGVLMLVLAVLMPLAQLAVTTAIADAYLSRPTTFASALQRASKRYLGYLGTSMLMMLALIPLLMLLIIPGIYFAIGWMLIGPVCVIEDIFGTKAMKRSRALVRGNYWRVFGLMLVSTIVVSVIGWGFGFVFAFIPILGAALTGAVQAITGTYTAAVVVVAYVDLRCRHENFDIELLAREVAGDHRSMAPAAAAGHDAASA